MNITVVGVGYVGLVTGACLAEVGNRVLCVDNNADKIRGLQAGRLPLFEPGLERLVGKNTAAGQLHFTTDIARGVDHGEVIFIAVGTPPDEEGAADLRYVLAVAQSIGQHIGAGDYRVVVNKSTVPVGTARRVEAAINDALEARGAADGIEFSVVANPEFLKQGAAVDDFMKPDRIIVGAADERALAVMRELYAPFNRNHERVIAMDIASAELTKYAANAMLAARISCMNEMSNIAGRLGADIEAVRLGIGADPRIGYSYIYPGCGYGGSCLPKDVQALIRAADAAGYPARILQAVEAVNQAQKHALVDAVIGHFGADLSGKRFALWGLAFKPDTDDMRAAPSRTVMENLWRRGASVRAFDPVATDSARRIYGRRDDLELLSADPYEALSGVDGLIVVTEWRMLRAVDPARIAAGMRGDVVVDGRNIYDPKAMRGAGLTYYGIGRR